MDTQGGASSKVFISFRNGDDPFAAALIYRELAQRFGVEATFRSVEAIEAGTLWRETIWRAHAASPVLIAVIGARWLDIADGSSRRRLFVEGDWVRDEIAVALREGKCVLPVLIEDTPRLAEADLPDDLKPLAALQSIRFSHRQVDVVLDQLTGLIEARAGLPRRDRHPAAASSTGAPATLAPAPAELWLGLWNVPPRPPGALDRPGLLGQVEAALGRSHLVVLHGPIGAGKTQAAIEYVHRYSGGYQGVWWIQTETPELVTTQLVDLAREAGFHGGDDLRESVPDLFAELRRHGRWLLVLDGAAGPAAMPEFAGGGLWPGDVLVTSRGSAWGLAFDRVGTKGFERDESVALLAAHTGAGRGRNAPNGDGAESLGRLAAERLGRLAAALDDLPAAVAQAATFMAATATPPHEYEAMLARRAPELLRRGTTWLGPSIATAWELGLARLVDGPAGAAAREIVELLAVCGPAPVRTALIGAASEHGQAMPALSAMSGDGLARADLLAALGDAGLIELDATAGTVRVGALFRTFTRGGLDPDRTVALQAALRLALARLPRGEPGSPASWPAYALVLPHVIEVGATEHDDPAYVRLVVDLANHLIDRGDPHTARDRLGRALDTWRPMLALDLRLEAQQALARAAYRAGDHQEAVRIDEEVLEDRLRLYGPGHPETLTAAHNLAIDRWSAGLDRPDARRRLEQTLTERTAVLGARHPDTLRSAHNVAAMRRVDGEWEAAREVDEATYRAFRDVLGPDHPDTLRSAYALGLDLRELDRPREAAELTDAAWRVAEVALGAGHPETLRLAYMRAVDLRNAGDTRSAYHQAVAAHDGYARAYGRENGRTLRAAMLVRELAAQLDRDV